MAEVETHEAEPAADNRRADVESAWREVEASRRERDDEISGADFDGFLDDETRREMATHGVGRRDAIQRLVNAHRALRTDPGAALAQLASQYGPGRIDPARAAHVIAELAHAAGLQPDPRATAAAFDLTQSRRQAEQAQAVQWANSQIAEFGKATDAHGNLKHPKFSDERVRHEMGKAIMEGRANDMAGAYHLVVGGSTKPAAKKPAAKTPEERRRAFRTSLRDDIREAVEKARARAGR